MIPVRQHNHDPLNGVWGNCHSACMASILELPIAVNRVAALTIRWCALMIA